MTSAKFLAEIIRHERGAHAWSQEQLALAAGVNLRTVQRVERGSSCSGETIQALAGALGLDAGVLVAATPIVCRDHRAFGLSGASALWSGALLCLPGLVFVVLNVAYYEWNVWALEPFMTSRAWGAFNANLLAPVIVMGGPVLAFILNAPHVVRLRTRNQSEATVVDGVVLRWRAGQWTVTCLALVLIATMVVFGAIENLEHMINGDWAG